MTETVFARARAGDGDAFRELVAPHLRELRVHCYRILGSLQDAEDALQETLVAAWRGLDQFEARASLRVWLYRIATNRCLNALRTRSRRPQRVSTMVPPPEPTRLGETPWLEPIPDALLEGIGDDALGPDARYEANEAITLTFVNALQHLPPRQRCVLVLRDVLGFASSEVATILDATDTSVKAALQRARSTLRTRLGAAPAEDATLPPTTRDRAIVDRFAVAVEAGDVEGVVALLTDDAWLTMPPEPFEYQGHGAIAGFLEDRARARRGNLVVVPTRANRQAAFGCYLPDPHAATARAYGLMVLTLQGGAVSAITWFGSREMMTAFELPPTIDLDR